VLISNLSSFNIGGFAATGANAISTPAPSVCAEYRP
jgi:hypothetical protein